MDEIEEIVFQPPKPIDIVRRALILSGVVCRASLEGYTDEEYKRETVVDLQDWFDELDLWAHLEPDEQKIIRSPLGKLPKHLEIQGTWFVEGLAILAWALQCSDFPPHDQKVDPIAVTNALYFLDPNAENLLLAQPLRGLAELQAAREWFYDVHCTLRGVLHYQGDGRLSSGIDEYLAILGLDSKVVICEGCLAVDGKPVVTAEHYRLQVWEDVIFKRHPAAIWLVGEDPLYTELTVDT